MPDSRDGRSANDILNLKAVFVPDDTEGPVPMHNIARSVGAGAVRIPAVFVPEGSMPPGHPYIHFGQMTLEQDRDGGAEAGHAPGQEIAGPMRSTQQEASPVRPPPHASIYGADNPPASPGADFRRDTDPVSRLRPGPAQSGLASNDQRSRLTTDTSAPARMVSGGFGLPGEASGSGDVSASRNGIAGPIWQAPADGEARLPGNIDASHDAIGAALRALTVMPTDGKALQSVDWATLANWPGSPLPGKEAVGELTEVAIGDVKIDREKGAIGTQIVSEPESEQTENTD